MMLGLVLIFLGGLLGVAVSWILGGIAIGAGILRIIMEMLAGDPKVERREYDSGPKTYTLHSSKPKAK